MNTMNPPAVGEPRQDGRAAATGRALLFGILLAIAGAAPGAHAQAEGEAPDTARVDTSEARAVEIIRADTLRQTHRDGRPIRLLLGSVALRQDSTRLYADRAEQYMLAEADSFLFEGDVRIVDEGDTLEAPVVRYFEGRRVGEASGGIYLTDGEVELWAPAGTYYLDAERADFRDGVRMVDSVSVLNSRSGTYFLEEKRAVFEGDVRLEQEGTTMRGDSLVHYREGARSHGFGSVRIEHRESFADTLAAGSDAEDRARGDTLRRTLLFGEEARYRRPTGESRMSGRPLVVQLRYDSTGVDTLMMRSERLRTVETDTLRRMIATGTVRFWERRLAATADSVIFERWGASYRPEAAAALVRRADTTGQRIRMYRDPMLWMRRNQITGDTLRMGGVGEAIDTLEVRSRAFVAAKDTVIERIHQLKGLRLNARLTGEELEFVRVGPQAQAIRYLKEENRPNGAVQLSSDRIRAWFRADSLRRVNASSGIEGTYFDESVLPDTLQLEGFRWEPDQRPRRETLMEGVPAGWRVHPLWARTRDESS